MDPDLQTLVDLKKKCLGCRLDQLPQEAVEIVWRLRTKQVEALSICTEGQPKHPAYFVVKSCEEKTTGWGTKSWWIKFSDDLPDLKRSYAYSDCPLPQGSLCLGYGRKKGYFFQVSKSKVLWHEDAPDQFRDLR